MKTGYCIKTIKYQLRCSHVEWFVRTEEYYRDVLNFYYQLLLRREEIWEDVYKRQLEKTADGLCGCLSSPCTGCRMAGPVSYTHLDVYKRQIILFLCKKTEQRPKSI